jgi:short subunit fatty acids transporter
MQETERVAEGVLPESILFCILLVYHVVT